MFNSVCYLYEHSTTWILRHTSQIALYLFISSTTRWRRIELKKSPNLTWLGLITISKCICRISNLSIYLLRYLWLQRYKYIVCSSSICNVQKLLQGYTYFFLDTYRDYGHLKCFTTAWKYIYIQTLSQLQLNTLQR